MSHTKSSPRTDLLDAIRVVHAGRRHIPPAIAVEIAEHRGDHDLVTILIAPWFVAEQVVDALPVQEGQ